MSNLLVKLYHGEMKSCICVFLKINPEESQTDGSTHSEIVLLAVLPVDATTAKQDRE